jgi:hypothetical protein
MSIEYIKQTDKGRICTHPQIEKYWEWGGCALGGEVYHYTSVKLKDGTEYNFKAEEPAYHDSIEQCNKFLNTIPE